ncbi:hypothetical protein [Gemmobacter caeni]|uniref:hypothetical protein n=1 Tax=Gemmobacter caeni TaxID=589035 RepID=UPI000D37ED20|nr:hypothetical protein [Gemmobacter caeni]
MARRQIISEDWSCISGLPFERVGQLLRLALPPPLSQAAEIVDRPERCSFAAWSTPRRTQAPAADGLGANAVTRRFGNFPQSDAQP